MIYKITSNGFPTVTISKLKKDEGIYAECNSTIVCSPVYYAELPEDTDYEIDSDREIKNGNLVRKLLTEDEVNGTGDEFKPRPRSTTIGRLWESFRCDVASTHRRQQLGEKTYVLYKALKDGQKVTFRSCFPGTIMAWNASPLADGEFYVKKGSVKSVLNRDSSKRPHGVLNVVTDSFLCADIRVKSKIYRTEDVNVLKSSGTKDRFQQFKASEVDSDGRALVFVEVHGDLIEVPLFPNESVDVFPGYLLGFTEGVSLKMISAGDVKIRNTENNDYVIRLTAGEHGGYVYANSVISDEFFPKQEKSDDKKDDKKKDEENDKDGEEKD